MQRAELPPKPVQQDSFVIKFQCSSPDIFRVGSTKYSTGRVTKFVTSSIHVVFEAGVLSLI